jgi:hypothetical protein
MTEEEFFEALEEARVWALKEHKAVAHIDVGKYIRTIIDGVYCCPIQLVYAHRDAYHRVINYLRAAEELELDVGAASAVIHSADGHQLLGSLVVRDQLRKVLQV